MMNFSKGADISLTIDEDGIMCYGACSVEIVQKDTVKPSELIKFDIGLEAKNVWVKMFFDLLEEAEKFILEQLYHVINVSIDDRHFVNKESLIFGDFCYVLNIAVDIIQAKSNPLPKIVSLVYSLLSKVAYPEIEEVTENGVVCKSPLVYSKLISVGFFPQVECFEEADGSHLRTCISYENDENKIIRKEICELSRSPLTVVEVRAVTS